MENQENKNQENKKEKNPITQLENDICVALHLEYVDDCRVCQLVKKVQILRSFSKN